MGTFFSDSASSGYGGKTRSVGPKHLRLASLPAHEGVCTPSQLTEGVYLPLSVSEPHRKQVCDSLPFGLLCCFAPDTKMRHLQPSL